MSLEKIKNDVFVNVIKEELVTIFCNNNWNLENIPGCVDQILFDMQCMDFNNLEEALMNWESETLDNYDCEMKK